MSLRRRGRSLLAGSMIPVFDRDLERLGAVVDAEKLERVERAAACVTGEAAEPGRGQVHTSGRVAVVISAREAANRHPSSTERRQANTEAPVHADNVGRRGAALSPVPRRNRS